jgi:wyosine [tRNA(Phe)-imidazoG37] synthetase (radical SAM superfamily)
MGKKKRGVVKAVVANLQGEIFDLEGYAAVGMAGFFNSPLTENGVITMPYGSELMRIPDRRPVVYNLSTGKLETLHENPFNPQEPLFPVSIFNSPGYVVTYNTAYEENKDAGFLPLFSYGAAGWYQGRMVTSAICIDKENRQDLRKMKQEKVQEGIKKMRQKMPDNSLRAHLETCAMDYGCPAAKNFFLGRYEAPLPTSQQCNAKCLGCISLQPDGQIPCSQKRISFTPTSEEIAEVALVHINRVKNAIVSFGQGCEGDPLLAAHVIGPAICRIRAETGKGTINMNTNASRPEILEKMFGAGLDSIRVSMNSTRKACYDAYFRPKGYQFSHVLESIRIADSFKKHVAINYLNCPGITDSPEELDSLIKFLENYKIHMIQWRNLNFDPLKYFQIMSASALHSRPIGMQKLIRKIGKLFPKIKFGYFNPPKEKYHFLIS